MSAAVQVRGEHPHLTRQLDIIPLEVLGLRLTIIGAGAVGSFTTLALAKMGFKDISVWDDDEVTVENMNCQFYRHSDIGKLKANALGDLVQDFTGMAIATCPLRYGPERDPLPGVVVSAVDSMDARRMIWGRHAKQSPATKLVIDPRMGAESALCYAMRPMVAKDCATYEKTLYTDNAAVAEPCTAKATMYTACMLAGFVAKVVKDYAVTRGDRYPRIAQWSITSSALEVHHSG